MKDINPYFYGSKLELSTFKSIVGHFSNGMSATDTARKVRVNVRSINPIFMRIRERIYERVWSDPLAFNRTGLVLCNVVAQSMVETSHEIIQDKGGGYDLLLRFSQTTDRILYFVQQVGSYQAHEYIEVSKALQAWFLDDPFGILTKHNDVLAEHLTTLIRERSLRPTGRHLHFIEFCARNQCQYQRRQSPEECPSLLERCLMSKREQKKSDEKRYVLGEVNDLYKHREEMTSKTKSNNDGFKRIIFNMLKSQSL